MTIPSPKPRTSIESDVYVPVVLRWRFESSSMPTAITAVPMIGNGRYFPHLLINRPLAIDVTSRPAIIGVSCKPDDVGLRPFEICRKTGR